MSTTTTSSSYQPVLRVESINPNVPRVEYAVRGELSTRANAYAEQLASSSSSSTSLPFPSVVTANIGNPQQQPYLAQRPLTFWRQVIAATELPSLLDDERTAAAFPADVQQRARSLLQELGSTGAYSHSKGALGIRKHVAEFIEQRDGYPANPEHIYLTSGASGGVQLLMTLLISSPSVGIAIPIPQYPLYSATLSLYNARAVEYYLDEQDDWSLSASTLSSSITQARERDGTDVRAIVVINPGNPTGQSLTYDNIAELLLMAHEQRLLVLADEVYQANIYQPDSRPFVAFKKVLGDFADASTRAGKLAAEKQKQKQKQEQEQGAPQEDLGARIAKELELVSFHSISKGFTGECGRRGGYFELVNIDAGVEAQVYKLASVSLCPSVQGQIGVDLLVRPPREGEESYALYKQESEEILQTLKKRSQLMQAKFNSLPGITCNEAQGALYLFPQVHLPPAAHEAAKKEKRKVDEFFCLALLDRTGICVVPGSGFGKMPQPDGSIFFRTTVLAKETDEFVNRFEQFHKEFLDKYK